MFGALHYYCYGKLIPDKLKKTPTTVSIPAVVEQPAEQAKEAFYGRFSPSY